MDAFSSLVISSVELAAALDKLTSNEGHELILLDIRSTEDYESSHIPGALRLDPGLLNRSEPPQNGLLPSAEQVATWSAQLGLDIGSNVVVYDGGKSTSAARALWVLNVFGFTNVHWLNGGITAWMSSNHSVSNTVTKASRAIPDRPLTADSNLVLSSEELKARLSNSSQQNQIVDARTRGEYEGSDVRSARGGRMPGAVHYEWLDMFQSDGTLLPDNELQAALTERNLDKEVPAVVYCQSHQRSSVTYLVLKHLGYKDVSALDGAWSNWGNDPTAPIEI